MFVAPFHSTRKARIAVCIDGHVEAAFVQVGREVPNEQFRTAVPPRWNFNEWWSDQSNVHVVGPEYHCRIRKLHSRHTAGPLAQKSGPRTRRLIDQSTIKDEKWERILRLSH